MFIWLYYLQGSPYSSLGCGEAVGQNYFGTSGSNIVGRHNHDIISMFVVDKVIVALIILTNITER
jgi:hypothetical protein